VGPLFETVTDLQAGAEVLRRRPYGVIEAIDGRLGRVLLRPFPKIVSVAEILLLGRWVHKRRAGDGCLVYYNQPRRFPKFLALRYFVSARDTTYATCCRALEALEEIARIKQTDALLANVANWRISPRLLARWGWEQHCPGRWGRHYIKRFYGQYPPRPRWLGEESKATQGVPPIGCETVRR
jgi:hypothetical protein